VNAATATPPVVSTVGAEIPRLAALLTVAFSDNPVSDWLFRGEQDAHHPAYFTAYLRHALAAGRVDQTADGTAVAVWIDRTRSRDLQTFHRESAEAVRSHMARLTLLEGTLYESQPRQPHWWLAFLGVLPTHRGRGHATCLLNHATGWQGNQLAYLEATSHRLVSLYHRHGFEASLAVHIPQDGPTVHPMWTRPVPSPC
jgi:GNAT superfamily N-acetyltransferase